jgi:hypothetical protein
MRTLEIFKKGFTIPMVIPMARNVVLMENMPGSLPLSLRMTGKDF